MNETNPSRTRYKEYKENILPKSLNARPKNRTTTTSNYTKSLHYSSDDNLKTTPEIIDDSIPLRTR